MHAVNSMKTLNISSSVEMFGIDQAYNRSYNSFCIVQNTLSEYFSLNRIKLMYTNLSQKPQVMAMPPKYRVNSIYDVLSKRI